MVDDGNWWSATATGITLAVRATPGAKKSAVMEVGPDHVRIRLAARPVEGQANKALIDFVAELCGVRKSAVTLVRGHTSRIKLVAVDGITAPPAELA